MKENNKPLSNPKQCSTLTRVLECHLLKFFSCFCCSTLPLSFLNLVTMMCGELTYSTSPYSIDGGGKLVHLRESWYCHFSAKMHQAEAHLLHMQKAVFDKFVLMINKTIDRQKGIKKGRRTDRQSLNNIRIFKNKQIFKTIKITSLLIFSRHPVAARAPSQGTAQPLL